MKYINVPRGHLDPHIFAIADGAYQGMISENRNQVNTIKHAMTSINDLYVFDLVSCDLRCKACDHTGIAPGTMALIQTT